MKINIVGTLPEKDAGMHRGPERTTIGLSEALADRGHDVTVWADEGHPQTVGVEAHVLVPDANPGVGRMFKFVRAFRKHDPDGVVHTWRPLLDCDVLSLHSLGMAETMRSEFPESIDTRFLLGAKVHRMGKLFTSIRADEVVMTAPGNLEYAEQYGLGSDSIDSIVPVGVEEKFIQEDAYSSLDVITVGRAEPRKQTHFVDHHTPSDYDVSIAGGESDPEYASRLSQRWEGRVPEERLLDLYSRAGVFVLPSYFEGFGLTAVEAMAAGTPIIVSDRIPISDWVEEYKLGGVYKWDDESSYRSTLEEVFGGRDSRSENAKGFVRERLTWDQIAKEYEEIYQDLE